MPVNPEIKSRQCGYKPNKRKKHPIPCRDRVETYINILFKKVLQSPKEPYIQRFYASSFNLLMHIA